MADAPPKEVFLIRYSDSGTQRVRGILTSEKHAKEVVKVIDNEDGNWWTQVEKYTLDVLDPPVATVANGQPDMSRPEETLVVIFDSLDMDPWQIYRIPFHGIRVRHGQWVEWPVQVTRGKITWAAYDFNGERSQPGVKIPPEVQAEVERLLLK